MPPLRTSSASLRSAPIPIPSGLRPSPLEKGSRPLKGKAEGDRKGRPYGGMRTGSVCSVKPGAEQKPHRLKFWGSQGPVAREETQIATQILRAGNIAGPNKYASPVMGVLGGGRHGGGEALPNRRLRPTPGGSQGELPQRGKRGWPGPLVTFWPSRKSLAARRRRSSPAKRATQRPDEGIGPYRSIIAPSSAPFGGT